MPSTSLPPVRDGAIRALGPVREAGDPLKFLLIAMGGGAIGAGLRYLVNIALGPALQAGAFSFPWSTFTVNVTGGFLMGLVYVIVGERLGGAPEWRVFLATGILGGFTTFSAYSLDMLLLYTSDGLGVRLAVYTLGSVVMAFVALLCGLWFARTLLA